MNDFGADEEHHREDREDQLWLGCIWFALVVALAVAIVGVALYIR